MLSIDPYCTYNIYNLVQNTIFKSVLLLVYSTCMMLTIDTIDKKSIAYRTVSLLFSVGS